jgi:hypothetical protein
VIFALKRAGCGGACSPFLDCYLDSIGISIIGTEFILSGQNVRMGDKGGKYCNKQGSYDILS